MAGSVCGFAGWSIRCTDFQGQLPGYMRFENILLLYTPVKLRPGTYAFSQPCIQWKGLSRFRFASEYMESCLCTFEMPEPNGQRAI